MKIDMHCHTKEGSLDARVPISEYISILKRRGIDGMLVTDHNSYQGYRYWAEHGNTFPIKDFVVLKGIEYDTSDAGHILVILPHGKHIPLIELRGMPVNMLIDIVHRHGGILGPAHPCGGKYLSLTNCKRYQKLPAIIQRFDFIETFNSCETPESNALATELADSFDKPGVGGSDSHKSRCVGTAFTDFEDANIRNEDDLIRYIKSRGKISAGGTYYHGTAKERMGFLSHFLTTSFWFYNKGGVLLRKRKRSRALTRDNERLLADQINFRDQFYDLDEDEEAEMLQNRESS